MKKIIKDWWPLILIFILIAFLIFGVLFLFVNSFFSNLFSYGITFFAMCIISFLVSGMAVFLVCYSINHYETKGKKIIKLLPIFLNSITFIFILLGVINNVKNFDIALCGTLLGIEWTIFGISGAVFLYQLQSNKKEMELLMKETDHIQQLKKTESLEINSMPSNFVFVLFVADLVFLILFTAGLFLLDPELKSMFLPYLGLISLYLTTNTIVTIFIQSISNYRMYRKEFIKDIKKSNN